MLFEVGFYFGGYINMVDVYLEGKMYLVDIGFLVFNEKIYFNLIVMFGLFGVDSIEIEMFFVVSLENFDFEWVGSNLMMVFGQKCNLFCLKFWLMFFDILCFNRESMVWLVSYLESWFNLCDFLVVGNYFSVFFEWYLLLMVVVIWFCLIGEMFDMLFVIFICFCQNYGLLQVFDWLLWCIVKGGGCMYVEKIVV